MIRTSASGLYVLERIPRGRYLWSLLTPMGEALLTSEHQAGKAQALATIDICRVQSPFPGQYRVHRNKNGSVYFALIGPDGETIGRSDAYASVALLEPVILAARAYGLSAVLEDRA